MTKKEMAERLAALEKQVEFLTTQLLMERQTIQYVRMPYPVPERPRPQWEYGWETTCDQPTIVSMTQD